MITHVFKDGTTTNDISGRIIPAKLSKEIIEIAAYSKQKNRKGRGEKNVQNG